MHPKSWYSHTSKNFFSICRTFHLQYNFTVFKKGFDSIHAKNFAICTTSHWFFLMLSSFKNKLAYHAYLHNCLYKNIIIFMAQGHLWPKSVMAQGTFCLLKVGSKTLFSSFSPQWTQAPGKGKACIHCLICGYPAALGIKPCTFCMLGKCSTIRPLLRCF